jgi:hypothetical protein
VPGILLSRLAVGIVVYVVIVLFATSLPLAAGVMLTFPALNGLAFFFFRQASVEPMARTMLWMPLINGALCALYILLFLWLASWLPPMMVAWCLAGLLIVLWLLIVTRRRVARGVELEHQLAYGVVSTVAGVGLTTAVLLLGRPETGAQVISFSGQLSSATFMLDTIERNQIKIILFGLCLFVFLLADRSQAIPDWIRGILAGLPIIPFAGLVSISADSGIAVEERLHIFRAMATSVWLSPAVPIWFVYCLSRFYSAKSSSNTLALDDAVRFLALVLGWLLCFLVILAISFVISLAY